MATQPGEAMVGPVTVPAESVLLLNRATVLAQLLPSAIHDLNNVLFLVSGSAELLLGRPGLPDDARVKLERILSQTERGTGILRRLSAEVTAPAASQPQEVDLGQTVAECVDARRSRLGKAGVGITLDVPSADGPLRARADPAHLRQILFNLLLNAERAAEQGRSIEIRAGGREGRVEVEVIDSGGAAMPPDPFAPFVTRGDPRHSAGLGLTAARLLAERYGGRIDYRPTADRRTRFVLTLPAVS